MGKIQELSQSKLMTKNDALDPVTVEVIRNKLEGIANEMESTLLRSSFSPIVKEGLDASASLFMINGESLAQACAVPIHLATLIPIVETIIREYPLENMLDGDIFIMNDPYLGGTHLPDIALIAPIFYEGRIIAFSAAMTHHQDVGGMTPGSIPTNATEIYQEGIRIPPLKLFEAGKINLTLINLLKLNVRIPETFMGDINAQIAACRIGARRVVELADLYGVGLLHAVFEALLFNSEIMTRERLRQIPQGDYEYSDWLDNDGIDLDTRIRIHVKVTVADGSFHVDFTGTSPQLRGPFNCVRSGSQAAAYFAVRALTDPEIPTNAGCFRPVSLTLPSGTLVNPVEPAPVGSRTATIKRITGAILAAFKETLPEKVPADSAGVLLALAFGGKLDNGKPYVVGELIAGGSGGSYFSDGVDVVETDASNCMNLPVEALELESPIRVRRLQLRDDSGGAGQFRGGLGLIKEFELLGESSIFTHRGERHYCPARGSLGGGDGQCEYSEIIRSDGSVEVIASKQVTHLMKGDRVVIQTPGGAGYGNPRDRIKEAVEEDILNGKVSMEKAVQLYGFLE